VHFYVVSLLHVHVQDDPCQSIPYRKHCILYLIGIFAFVETLGALLVTSEDYVRFGIMLLIMKRTVFWMWCHVV
jgi:Na+/proline symporter